MTGAIPGDLELVRRALACDADAFRIIMQTHNQRLFRIARAVAGDDSEAEDIVQQAYVDAFAHFAAFRGESALSTWLCRIVVNEALGRLRRQRLGAASAGSAASDNSDDPERTLAQRQVLTLVEQAIDTLPPAYRVVLVARAIEGLSNEETAELLGLRPGTVRTRLHRARLLIRRQVDEQAGAVQLDAFPFKGRSCERLTAAVLDRLGFPHDGWLEHLR